MGRAHMASRHLSTRLCACVRACVRVHCNRLTPHHLLSLSGLTIHSQGIDALPIAEMDFWGCCKRQYAGLGCLICVHPFGLWMHNKVVSFRNQRKVFLCEKWGQGIYRRASKKSNIVKWAWLRAFKPFQRQVELLKWSLHLHSAECKCLTVTLLSFSLLQNIWSEERKKPFNTHRVTGNPPMVKSRGRVQLTSTN